VPGPAEIRDGDIVLIHRVELYYARIERAGARDVGSQPLNRRIPDRRFRVEEIGRAFRDVGTPSPAARRLLPTPRQRRFDDLDGRGR
jgi:hypothetical protein